MFYGDQSWVLVVFILLKGAQLAICEAQTDSEYRKLREHLVKEYDPKSRPVLEHSQTTQVKLALAPVHVVDMNEKQGTLKMDYTASISWQDEHLKWNPEDFSGIKIVHFQAAEIWKPDLKVYSGRAYVTTPWMYGGLSVNSSGIVSWFPACFMFSICKSFDYSSYPKDVQSCELVLGSWTASVNEIDLHVDEMPADWWLYYYEKSNPHWEITNFVGKKVTVSDPDAGDQVTVKYEIEMKRTLLIFSFS